MKLRMSLVLISLFLVACGSMEPLQLDAKKASYQVILDTKIYQFFYPEKGLVTARENEGNIDLSAYNLDCPGVDFGNADNYKQQILDRTDMQGSKIANSGSGDKLFESWFVNDKLVFYSKYLAGNGFGFFAFDDGKEVTACMSVIDELSDSFSSDLAYVNDEYGFSVKIPPNLKVEYLENGVLLKKWIDPKAPEPVADDEEVNVLDLNPVGYKVEIIVWPIANPNPNEDLALFIGKKYPGYSIEAKDYAAFSGYFVDESSKTLDAVRHFFTMSSNKDVIYEAFMTLPSMHYDENKKFFDEFVEQNLKVL